MKKIIQFICYAILVCFFTNCTSYWIDEKFERHIMVMFDTNDGSEFYTHDKIFVLSSTLYECIYLPDKNDVWHLTGNYYSLVGFTLNDSPEMYPPNTRFEIYQHNWYAYNGSKEIGKGVMPSNHTFVFKAIWGNN